MTGKENPLEELEKAYAQWESLYKQGGSDPFYPDGVNLNLVRNHILYFKRQIEETQPLYMNSEAYQRELPPQVEDGYMARAEEIRAHAKASLVSYGHGQGLGGSRHSGTVRGGLPPRGCGRRPGLGAAPHCVSLPAVQELREPLLCGSLYPWKAGFPASDRPRHRTHRFPFVGALRDVFRE